MKYVRLYTGADGLSHFEDREMEFGPVPGRHSIGTPWPATQAIFMGTEPAGAAAGQHSLAAWHNAPARQFVVILAGDAEYEASDGEVRRLGPGDVMLAEDTTGKGHRARHLGARRAIHIPLAGA